MAGAEGMTRKDELSVPQCPPARTSLATASCTACAGSVAKTLGEQAAHTRVKRTHVPQSPTLAHNSRRRAWCAHAASEWTTMAQPTSGASPSPAGCRCRTAAPASTTARSTINGRLAGDASSGEGCSGGGGGSLGSGSCGGGEGSGGYHKDPGHRRRGHRLKIFLACGALTAWRLAAQHTVAVGRRAAKSRCEYLQVLIARPRKR